MRSARWAYFDFAGGAFSAAAATGASPGGRRRSPPRVIAMRPVRAISSTPKGRKTSRRPSILSTVPETSTISDAGDLTVFRGADGQGIDVDGQTAGERSDPVEDARFIFYVSDDGLHGDLV